MLLRIGILFNLIYRKNGSIYIYILVLDRKKLIIDYVWINSIKLIKKRIKII